MAQDNFTVEILPDGSVKIVTDGISQPNHKAADAFLEFLKSKLGGEVETIKRPQAHHHHHAHEKIKAGQ